MSLRISLTPDQVQQRLTKLGIPCRFTDGERERLSAAPPISIDAGLMGFPIPEDNGSLTLSNIRKIVGVDPARQPSIFDHSWYAGEAFMEKPCPGGWRHIYMDVLPESVGQPADYPLASGLELPSAVEVVLMLFLHYAGNGEQLLSRKHTWCAEHASGGRRVTVGAFGRNGVFLSAHPPGFGSRGLGICPKL